MVRNVTFKKAQLVIQRNAAFTHNSGQLILACVLIRRAAILQYVIRYSYRIIDATVYRPLHL